MNEWIKSEIEGLIEDSKGSLACGKKVVRESDKLHYTLESIAESLLAMAMLMNERKADD